MPVAQDLNNEPCDISYTVIKHRVRAEISRRQVHAQRVVDISNRRRVLLNKAGVGLSVSGRVSGQEQVRRCWVPFDADPAIDLVMRNGVSADAATAWSVINAVPAVQACQAGTFKCA